MKNNYIVWLIVAYGTFQVILIFLKLNGVLRASWLITLLPLLVTLFGIFVGMLVAGIIEIILEVIEAWKN